MPGEVAYAASKAAIAGITATIAHQLAPRGITVNTVDPGPVNTGYLDGAAGEELLHLFPFGRLGEPDDPARLIAWLVGEEARWVTGQVITTDGGFSLN
jgi:3-oxoacyl-[acyl-carrier protein] reductase